MTVTPSSVRDLLTYAELSEIEKAPLIPTGRHPTWYPIFYDEPKTVEFLTNQSVALVAQAGGIDWLRALHGRLTRLEDPEDAAAALAELRAYGGLLHAGFGVSPIAQSEVAAPEFSVDAGDESIVVEVFTKHQYDEHKHLLSGIAAGGTPPGVERFATKGEYATIETTVSVLQPGGAPDPTRSPYSIRADLISRVCAATGDETQLSDKAPSLLWIDFRSFGPWPEAMKLEQAAPLISGRDGLTSGALWYAFYGWRGAPIFEDGFFPRDRVVSMEHDGRFRITGEKKTKLSGAILVLSDGLILLENPWTAHPLSDRARRLCERLPCFDLGRAVCNWSPGDALALADLGRHQIEAMEHWREVFEGD
jgi:hypothetical protein